jgi:septal ring factor EnvC (AmiA/AmiB activator)
MKTLFVSQVLLQAPSIWNVQGSITVVGLLLLAVAALYLGFVTPKTSVDEIRTRLKEREAENATLHADVIKRIEENAELRGQLQNLTERIRALEEEVRVLRRSAQGGSA